MMVDDRPKRRIQVVATSYYTRFISPGYRYAAICFKSHHYGESRPLPRWPLTRLVCHVVKRQNADRAAGRNQNQKRRGTTTSDTARFLATAVLWPTRSVARTRSRLFEFMIIEEHNCAGGTRGHTIRERQRPRFALLSRGIPHLR